MLRFLQSDLIKLLIYFLLALAAATLLVPSVYQLSMFIADVVPGKSQSSELVWLALKLGSLPAGAYFKIALILVSFVMFWPFVMCLNLGSRADGSRGRHGPWRVKLTQWNTDDGQPLNENPTSHSLLSSGGHFITGFILLGGVSLLMFWGLISLEWTSFKQPTPSQSSLMFICLVLGALSILLGFFIELVFRGMLLGIMLRAAHPLMAVIVSAAVFAILFLPMADASLTIFESSRGGWFLLKKTVASFVSEEEIWLQGLGLWVLGALLGYARFRTASLWLSTGLLSGGWFILLLFRHLTTGITERFAHLDFLVGDGFLAGMIPVSLLVATLLFVHVFANLLQSRSQPSESGAIPATD